MIDEKKLIEELETMIADVPISYVKDENHDKLNAYLHALSRVISNVKRQPKVNEWISVEKRLPKQFIYVLVSCNNGEVDCGYYYNGVWVLDFVDSEAYSVIAWQSLPEPYKGE